MQSCWFYRAAVPVTFLSLVLMHGWGTWSSGQPLSAQQKPSASLDLERVQKPEERLRLLRQAIRQSPKEANLYYQAGQLDEQLGRWEEALRDYQMVFQLNPEFVDAYYRAGHVSERLGETYFLGKSRVVKKPNLRYAISLYQRAIRLKPDFSDAYYVLSLAHLMDGDLRQASEACQQLCQLEPESERTRKLVQRIYEQYLTHSKKQ